MQAPGGPQEDAEKRLSRTAGGPCSSGTKSWVKPCQEIMAEDFDLLLGRRTMKWHLLAHLRDTSSETSSIASSCGPPAPA